MARTILITALGEGLKNANATFTLPHMQKAGQEDAIEPAIAHMISSTNQVPT